MISLSHFKILFQMLFLVRVTSTEYNWVTLAEGRQGNRLILPEQLVADRAAPIQRRSRLGGMLNYYHRQAA